MCCFWKQKWSCILFWMCSDSRKLSDISIWSANTNLPVKFVCEWFANILYRIAMHTLAPNSTNNQIRGGFHRQLSIFEMLITIYERLHVCAFSHLHIGKVRSVRVRVRSHANNIYNIEWIKRYLKRKYRLNAIEANCTHLLHNLNDIAFNFNVSKSVCVYVRVCTMYVCVRAWARASEIVCVSKHRIVSQPVYTTGTERIGCGGSKAHKHVVQQQRKYH